MDRKPTDAEDLFLELSKVASDRGFILEEAAFTSRPDLRTRLFSEHRVRSREAMDRLPSAKVIDNLLG